MERGPAVAARVPHHRRHAHAGRADPPPDIPWLQTAADPTGRAALGTLNNCASGPTPWGTYLTCEENFNGYFVNRSGAVPPLQKRYGINERGFGYRWHEHDARFDAAAHPNEPNRFGWVVEVDPYDPGAAPVKHTALGRFKHEGATVRAGRATAASSSTWATTSASSTSTSS